jgi:energy-coupling factor transporter transmembrane protein EcfT
VVFAGTHRFAQKLAERARVLRDAQALRHGYVNRTATMRSLTALATVLFIDAASMAARADVGLSARGLGPLPPTPRRYESFSATRAWLLTAAVVAPWLVAVSW